MPMIFKTVETFANHFELSKLNMLNSVRITMDEAATTGMSWSENPTIFCE